MNKALIYDWNRNTPPQQPPVVMLDDETLRDGLQSPSVRAPSIAQKLRILRLLDEIGVDTADIGLPGAGLDDNDLCCLENAGRGKHYYTYTPPWRNTDRDADASAEI